MGALMARLMGVTEQLRLEARALGNEGAALVEQQAVHQSPTVRGSPLRKLTAKVLRLYVIIVLELGTQGVVVGEERPGQGQDRRYILVALRQRIGDGVELPCLVLDCEVVSKQLGDLGLLGYHREALVEDELEALVVGAGGERTTPNIRPQMTNGLDQADELALISRELGVVGGNGVVEVRHDTIALVWHNTKPCTRSVTVNNEALVEVR